MRRGTLAFFFAMVFASASFGAGTTGREALEAIRAARLDPTQLYRVHDATFYREDLRIYLNEGTLAFLQPVMGKVTGAVFVGEGEVLLIPPNSLEKRSLAYFTGAPVLNEKFNSALFRFTDDTYERMRESIANRESADLIEDPELVAKWNPVVGNLHGVHEMRVLTDLLAAQTIPFFAVRISGDRLGIFDIHLDYRLTDQLTVGQINTRELRRYNDIWCSFTVKSVREKRRPAPRDPLVPLHYRIESRLLPTRLMQVNAEVDIHPAVSGERVLHFELSRSLKVSSVQVQARGAPAAVDAEYSQNELVEESEIRRRGNDQITVILPAATVAAQPFTLFFKYQGEVISDAGNGVLFVGSRGVWYPNRGLLTSALFDLTFHVPKRLTLVATGDRIEDKEEGEWRVSRWKSRVPLRVAGFNLGEYTRGEAKAAGVAVEVYANKMLEPALQQRASLTPLLVDPTIPMRPSSTLPRRSNPRNPQVLLAMPALPPDPRDITQEIARDAGQNIEFYTKAFGPLPFGRIAISPIPGNFGQGWPGLVYISTLSFLLPFERSPHVPRTTEIFYRTVLRSHELAHQWWGNVVMPASYRDEWLVEALSNYSALMYLETRKGGDEEMRIILERSREELLEKQEDETADSAGPPVLGYRLNSSRTPGGVDMVMYKKGTWIMHMLRQLMRDPATGSDTNFFSFLRAVRQGFSDRALTTEHFRQLAEKYVVPAANFENGKSLEWFFDQWAYSTGIPMIHVKSSIDRKTGKAVVKGAVALDGVDESFGLPVPIYAQSPRGPVFVGTVSATGKETPFQFTLPPGAQRVVTDPHSSLLAVVR